MKLCHAAALALMGWYLMLPPTDGPKRFDLNPDAPITRWEIEKGFDTARECEHEKAVDFHYRISMYGNPKLKFMVDVMDGKVPPKNTAEFGMAQALDRKFFEKCVANDDPRLANRATHGLHPKRFSGGSEARRSCRPLNVRLAANYPVDGKLGFSFPRQLAHYSTNDLGRRHSQKLDGLIALASLRKNEKVANLHVESLSQLDKGVHLRAALASEDFGEMALGKLCLQIETV